MTYLVILSPEYSGRKNLHIKRAEFNEQILSVDYFSQEKSSPSERRLCIKPSQAQTAFPRLERLSFPLQWPTQLSFGLCGSRLQQKLAYHSD